MQPVFRIEAEGEAATPYPTLAAAMRLSPQSRESYVATSIDGVHLADAVQRGGEGGVLVWVLTLAGRDVSDKAGWSDGAPALSDRDSETVLATALREAFEAAS